MRLDRRGGGGVEVHDICKGWFASCARSLAVTVVGVEASCDHHFGNG